ncbi:MAG TPA: TetR/AcrR family transcriptional regulator [Streptosporangiaceae bacterium]
MTRLQEPAAARPLRKDAERNRQRILRAAAEVFTTRGLQTSLDDVARHAGVGVGTVYRRFPDKNALVDALFEERLQQIVGLAEQAWGEPDSWVALATFLEKAGELLAADRGLREILMFATYGRDRIATAKGQMQPAVTKLVARAQQDGKLRADVEPTDFPFVEFMLTAAAEYGDRIQPGIWRRYLTIILDGLRPRRDTVTPLPVPALTPDQMLDVMRSIPRRH